jgi:hypothetical protein
MSLASALRSEMSRRSLGVLTIVVFLIAALLPVQAAGLVCASCDGKIQLTKKQLACLNQTIERLIDESKSVSPVFFEVTDCSTAPTALPSSKLPSDIRVGQSKTGESPGVFFVLSSAQLQCFKKNISYLLATEQDMIAFDFSGCE